MMFTLLLFFVSLPENQSFAAGETPVDTHPEINISNVVKDPDFGHPQDDQTEKWTHTLNEKRTVYAPVIQTPATAGAPLKFALQPIVRLNRTQTSVSCADKKSYEDAGGSVNFVKEYKKDLGGTQTIVNEDSTTGRYIGLTTQINSAELLINAPKEFLEVKELFGSGRPVKAFTKILLNSTKAAFNLKDQGCFGTNNEKVDAALEVASGALDLVEVGAESWSAYVSAAAVTAEVGGTTIVLPAAAVVYVAKESLGYAAEAYLTWQSNVVGSPLKTYKVDTLGADDTDPQVWFKNEQIAVHAQLAEEAAKRAEAERAQSKKSILSFLKLFPSWF